MLDKIYLEITNVCNMNCSFCHKTSRRKRFMTEEEFDALTDRLRGSAKYLYFHLMGEPTLHPLLPLFIDKAREKGFLPMLTTNGALLGSVGEVLLSHPPYKISISLHAPEANPSFADEKYLQNCIDFSKKAAENGTIVALRLWNLGSGADNSNVLARLREEFPDAWTPIRGGSSERLAQSLFLEWGDRFEWPDESGSQSDGEDRAQSSDGCSSGGEDRAQSSDGCSSGGEDRAQSSDGCELFCYALRNHAAVLVDGSVVPCCLDADGVLSLGNLFDSTLADILSSPRAKRIYDGFSRRRAVEPLCKSCDFAKKFSKKPL